MTDIAIVQVPCPDREAAETIARALLEERLIACANILGPCHSIYRWRGAVETADEVVMQIKTWPPNVGEVRRRIALLHPYDLPSIEHWIAGASPETAAWIASEIKQV